MNPSRNDLILLLLGGGLAVAGVLFLLPKSEAGRPDAESPEAELEARGNPDVLVGLGEVPPPGEQGRFPMLIPVALAVGAGGLILLQRRS